MAGTVLVTGAAQGIGAAIAKRFAKEGYHVAINCRTEESLNIKGLAVKEACEASGADAECFVCDVSDYAACEQMVKAVKERFGSIDVLVNNAGITRDGLLSMMKEADFDAVTNANYKSVYNMTKLVGKIMIRQRGGRIINLTSVAGVHGNAGQFNYSASKAGVIGMTLSAAKELGGRGITVNAVAPGFIETPMTDVLKEEYKEAIRNQTSLKRFGKPEDVAGVVSFLAGEDAGFITGQVIEVSGGLTM